MPLDQLDQLGPVLVCSAVVCAWAELRLLPLLRPHLRLIERIGEQLGIPLTPPAAASKED